MGLYASFDDIQEAAYGMNVPVSARASIERLITKAETRLLSRVPSIPARIVAGTLDQDLVQGVIEDVVIRLVRNPNGYSSEQAGAFSYRIDKLASSSGVIQITDDDVADLLPNDSRRGFGSVRLGVPAWRLPR